jgi:hypothetical protein
MGSEMMEEFIGATPVIESRHPGVVEFARGATLDASSDIERGSGFITPSGIIYATTHIA